MMLQHILILFFGMSVGAILGVVIMACLSVASKADEQEEKRNRQAENK